MIKAFYLALSLISAPLIAYGQVEFPQLPQPVISFAYEDQDAGIAATTSPNKAHSGPTPISIPGARVIKTLELNALLNQNKNVIIIDVLSTKTPDSIPGAVKMQGAGDAPFYAAEKNRFSSALEKLTGGDKTRPIVFLCYSHKCWLSYNAALYALEAGYKDVIWYRGGYRSWTGASLAVKKPELVAW